MEIRTFRSADGTRLFYAITGPRDGVPIVLCHGLAANGRQFEADARYFAGLGYRVIVPDVRGHGRSEFPAGYTRAGFAIPVMAEDMLALLDNAGVTSAHWVGNSLGGIIALQMLAMAPERFLSLSLFGTAFRLKLPVITGPVFPLLYRLLGKGWLSELTAVSTTRERAGRTLIAEMIAAFDPRVGQAITGHVRAYDLTANALGWSGPMLILVGGMDRAVNLVLKPALRRIGARENWRVVQLPEGGHCANLDATEQFREELLGFWAVA
ncbi:MAG: alpha/beta fold hydrolase [Devosia sp.]|uniref:alpha/beta fold hydrolase n=1 Tax=Devosia sp. TaxID=1871048 RepID=UPI00261B0C2E|nr:alpha/beta hydrolase [Devosia sp.]MDB5585622.1 alpha/beta fold hydrolase [Devosia sp.]